MGSISNSGNVVPRILDTAAEIFSEVGFAGARMDVIADRAGVNKATIYYHIGNKKTLYARVLHEHFSRAVDRFDQRLQKAETPREKLSSFIHQIAHEMEHNSHKATMMLREAMDGGKNVPESVSRDLAGIIKKLTQILADGEKEGSFIKVDPFTVHFLIIGALAFYRISRPVREKVQQALSPPSSDNAGGKAVFADELERLIMKSLTPV